MNKNACVYQLEQLLVFFRPPSCFFGGGRGRSGEDNGEGQKGTRRGEAGASWRKVSSGKLLLHGAERAWRPLLTRHYKRRLAPMIRIPFLDCFPTLL